jgi:hypothetical protein
MFYWKQSKWTGALSLLGPELCTAHSQDLDLAHTASPALPHPPYPTPARCSSSSLSACSGLPQDVVKFLRLSQGKERPKINTLDESLEEQMGP